MKTIGMRAKEDELMGYRVVQSDKHKERTVQKVRKECVKDNALLGH